jgi:hypothetical protein
MIYTYEQDIESKTFNVKTLISKETICDILFHDVFMIDPNTKLTKKLVDETVKGHLYANGISCFDDIGYYRKQCTDAGEQLEVNDKIEDYVYNKYKM